MSVAPSVSAVIPAYNAAGTIAETVRSVLSQSIDDLEVIVVDDGSRDETAELALSTADSRVRVVSRPNGGAAAARNAGIGEARGKYVAFLDADDMWLPEKLETQLAILERQPDVCAVQSGAIYVDDALTTLSVRRCRRWADPLWDVLMFQNLPAFPSTVVVAREALEARGGFDTSLVILEDWELAIYAARHWRLQSVEQPLTLYRVHPGNRSRDLTLHVEPGLEVLRRLFTDPTLPAHIVERRETVYARFYTMLAGGAFKGRDWNQFVRWIGKALRTDPKTVGYMLKMPLRRLERRPSDDPVVQAAAVSRR